MKTTFLTLVLTLFLGLSYGQISIKELIDISYMNSEEFEIFTMSKGYVFSSIINEFDKEALCMKEIKSRREIRGYTGMKDQHFVVRYISYNISELEKIYRDLGLLGFKLEKRINEDGFYKKIYKNFSLNEELFYVAEIHIDSDFFYIWFMN